MQVDAKKILKPFSHDKYIKEPEPGVVFVSRRDGLVPLFSLGRLFPPVEEMKECLLCFQGGSAIDVIFSEASGWKEPHTWQASTLCQVDPIFLCISQSWKANVFGSSDVCNFCNFPSGKEGD